jgi:hypothetical protein
MEKRNYLSKERNSQYSQDNYVFTNSIHSISSDPEYDRVAKDELLTIQNNLLKNKNS